MIASFQRSADFNKAKLGFICLIVSLLSLVFQALAFPPSTRAWTSSQMVVGRRGRVGAEARYILGQRKAAKGDEGWGGVKGYWMPENSPGGRSIVYSYLFFWLFALGLWPINSAAIPHTPAAGERTA